MQANDMATMNSFRKLWVSISQDMRVTERELATPVMTVLATVLIGFSWDDTNLSLKV